MSGHSQNLSRQSLWKVRFFGCPTSEKAGQHTPSSKRPILAARAAIPRRAIPSCLLLVHMDVMCRSPPSSAPPFGASNASEGVWSRTSGTGRSTTQLSFCSSDGVAGSLRIWLKTPEPAHPATPEARRSSLYLHDLKLTAEDMTGSRSSLAPSIDEACFLFDEDGELSLTWLTNAPLAAARLIGPIAWAASPTASNGKASNQPWGKFWPPALDSPWFAQVAEQRPDVLYFSFDHRNHLLRQNYPWQMWKSQHPAIAKLDDEDILDGTELASALPGTHRSLPAHRCLSNRSKDVTSDTRPAFHPPVSASTQLVRDELDDLIQVDLQLPSVTPRQFNYLCPLQRYQYERPYRLQLPPGLVPMPTTNVRPRSYPVRIYDMSGHEDRFTLDVAGFQFLKCPVAVGEWDDRAVTETYLPALLDWVVAVLGGVSGLVYSYNVSLLPS